MEVFNLESRISSRRIGEFKTQLSGWCRIRGLSDSNLAFEYNEGELSAELIQIEEDSVTERDISAWYSLVNSDRINKIQGRYFTKEILELNNISYIVFSRIDFLEEFEEFIFSDRMLTEKSLTYFGRQVNKAIKINGEINSSIIEFNIPLNQDLKEFINLNPNIVSLGIDGDKFSYWKSIPEITRLIVFVSSESTKHIISHHLRNFSGMVNYIMWK